MYNYHAVVMRVIDGDTVELLVDLGFGLHKKCRVRLLANAPEVRTRDKEEKIQGMYVKKKLEELIDSKPVTLNSQKLDKYGRSLGDLFTEDEKSVSQMVEQWVEEAKLFKIQ